MAMMMQHKKIIFEFLTVFFLFIKSRLISHSIYIFISVLIGYFLVDIISLGDLKPIIGTLQNISAAVFTLAGIWIAYSYPQAIASYTSPKTVTIIPNDETKRIENLVLIVLTSAFVISSLLIENMLYLLVYKSFKNHAFIHNLNILAIASIFYLSFIQIKAVFIVMITNISFVNELHSKKTEREASDDL